MDKPAQIVIGHLAMNDEANLQPQDQRGGDQETPPSGVRRVETNDTQTVQPRHSTRPITPIRRSNHQQIGMTGGSQPRAQATSPQGARPKPDTARYRRENAVFLPLWSLTLLLILVALVAGGIVMLVIALGGNDGEPDRAPVVVMSSAVPTTRPDSFPAAPTTPTLPAFADRSIQQPIGTFALAGPTLATPAISPTPRPVDIGAEVIVVDVGDQQLNIRDDAGVFETVVLFRIPEGGRLVVLEGPLQVDGLTWWRVQDATNPNQTGWAAANYLQVPPEGS